MISWYVYLSAKKSVYWIIPRNNRPAAVYDNASVLCNGSARFGLPYTLHHTAVTSQKLYLILIMVNSRKWMSTPYEEWQKQKKLKKKLVRWLHTHVSLYNFSLKGSPYRKLKEFDTEVGRRILLLFFICMKISKI